MIDQQGEEDNLTICNHQRGGRGDNVKQRHCTSNERDLVSLTREMVAMRATIAASVQGTTASGMPTAIIPTSLFAPLLPVLMVAMYFTAPVPPLASPTHQAHVPQQVAYAALPPVPPAPPAPPAAISSVPFAPVQLTAPYGTSPCQCP